MTETRTYTPDEYASQMRVSVKTIYRQLKTGRLKGERIGHQWRIVRCVLLQPNSGHHRTLAPMR